MRSTAPKYVRDRRLAAFGEAIMLRPEVAGRVQQIHFSDGQQVAAGALLVTLDDALVRAELNEANANLANSRRAYGRARELAQKQLIARADLDKAQAALGVDQARAASAATRMSKAQIRAPFGGVIGLRKVSVGDLRRRRPGPGRAGAPGPARDRVARAGSGAVQPRGRTEGAVRRGCLRDERFTRRWGDLADRRTRRAQRRPARALRQPDHRCARA
jgi:multidrug efflux pump subunit AcrA (membrane-fusion protein)